MIDPRIDNRRRRNINSVGSDVYGSLIFIFFFGLFFLVFVIVGIAIDTDRYKMLHEQYDHDHERMEERYRSLKRIQTVYLVQSMEDPLYIENEKEHVTNIPYQSDAFVNRDDAIAFLEQRVKDINEDNDNDPEQALTLNPHIPYFYSNQDEMVWMSEISMFEKRDG